MWYSKIDDPTGEWELFEEECHGMWIPLEKTLLWTIDQLVEHFMRIDGNEVIVVNDTEFVRICMMEEFGPGVFVHRTYKWFPDDVNPNA